MLTQEEYLRFKSIAQNGAVNGDAAGLAPNAVTFLEDMHERILKYRRQTLISDKQEVWLNQLENDLKEALGAEYEDLEE